MSRGKNNKEKKKKKGLMIGVKSNCSQLDVVIVNEEKKKSLINESCVEGPSMSN